MEKRTSLSLNYYNDVAKVEPLIKIRGYVCHMHQLDGDVDFSEVHSL